MKEYTITRVFIDTEKKDKATGEMVPLITKTGKPFWKVTIKTEETGDAYYSSLVFEESAAELKLVSGQKVGLILTEENGFKNFKLPERIDEIDARLTKVEETVY